MKELRHDALSVYGIVDDYSADEIREIAGLLVEKGLLRRNEGEYPTLAVTAAGRRFLKSRETLTLTRLKREEKRVSAAGRAALDFEQALFEELRGLRSRLAAEKRVPPYVIFSDAALQQMAYYFPQSRESFSRISGVGRMKLEQLGEAFIAVIGSYARRHDLAERSIPVARRGRRQTVVREDSTYEKTRQLLEQGLSVEQVAEKRGLRESRIVYHLQRLLEAGSDIESETDVAPAGEG